MSTRLHRDSDGAAPDPPARAQRAHPWMAVTPRCDRGAAHRPLGVLALRTPTWDRSTSVVRARPSLAGWWSWDDLGEGGYDDVGAAGGFHRRNHLGQQLAWHSGFHCVAAVAEQGSDGGLTHRRQHRHDRVETRR